MTKHIYKMGVGYLQKLETLHCCEESWRCRSHNRKLIFKTTLLHNMFIQTDRNYVL